MHLTGMMATASTKYVEMYIIGTLQCKQAVGMCMCYSVMEVSDQVWDISL